MRTTIKASCPACGEVELTSNDVTLMLCNHAPRSYYTFRCPSCVDVVKKPADDHVVSLLLSGGVRAETWDLPAEVLEVKTGPALTYDDVLDFVLELQSTDRVAAAAAVSLGVVFQPPA